MGWLQIHSELQTGTQVGIAVKGKDHLQGQPQFSRSIVDKRIIITSHKFFQHQVDRPSSLSSALENALLNGFSINPARAVQLCLALSKYEVNRGLDDVISRSI